jgi:transcriptional regulator with XRE-family HTH domain
MAFSATKLRSLREREGLSRYELAKRSGLNQAGLLRLEGGRIKNPRPGTLTALAVALGVSADAFDDNPTSVSADVARRAAAFATRYAKLPEADKRGLERLMQALETQVQVETNVFPRPHEEYPETVEGVLRELAAKEGHPRIIDDALAEVVAQRELNQERRKNGARE